MKPSDGLISQDQEWEAARLLVAMASAVWWEGGPVTVTIALRLSPLFGLEDGDRPS